jgi:hypothetical protein
MPLVLGGATSGSTTLTPVDAVTATITLPSVTSTLLAVAAAGTANQKLFMNAAGTQQEFAKGFYVGSTTRVMTAGAGTVAYTGVGFKPSAIIVLMSGALGTGDWSAGFTDGTTQSCIAGLASASGNVTSGASTLVFEYQSAGVNQQATLQSLDSDGFTLSWAKNGSPTGTAYLCYLCFR